MKVRPFEFSALSLACALICIGLPMQIAWIYGISPFTPHGWFEIGGLLTDANWIVMALAGTTAALAYHASPWLSMALPVFTAVVLYNNWLVAQSGLLFSPANVGIASAVFCLGVTAVVTERLRSLLKKPELRWWRTAKRYPLSVPILSSALETTTYDISENGAFLLSHSNQLRPGQTIDVSLPLPAGRVVRCKARVVRRDHQPKGNYPAGTAIQFADMSSSDRREIKRWCREMTGNA